MLPYTFEFHREKAQAFLGKHLITGRDDPPDQDPAAVKKFFDRAGAGGKDLGIGINIEGQDIEVETEHELPVGIAAEMNAARAVDCREKGIEIGFRLLVAVTGHRRKDELHPRFIDEHEGIGIAFLQSGQLDIDPFGHELEHERSDGVIEQDGAIVLVEDVEAEADRPFELAADCRPVGEIPGQEIVVDDRVLLADIEVGRIVEPAHGLFEFVDKFRQREAQGLFFHIQQDTGKMLCRLDVHVFVIVVVRQLWPEWDIQGQGKIKGLLDIGLGHDGHGCGQKVSGDRHGLFLL